MLLFIKINTVYSANINGGKTSRYRGKCRSVVRLELGHLKFQTYARIYIQLLDFSVIDSSKVINQFVQRYTFYDIRNDFPVT